MTTPGTYIGGDKGKKSGCTFLKIKKNKKESYCSKKYSDCVHLWVKCLI